ncbi:MAG TPA: hypothetical protein VLF43_04175 [Candidatus Saccharimonadales bacterium]|nr:hypothetical protein [Candidatus Saccharimonadales bacterium]
MPHNLALIIALAVPTLLFVVLRVNASMVFLSLCLGAVLVQYVASEAITLMHLMSAHVSPVSASSVQLILLLAPAVVTGVVTVFSVQGQLKAFANMFPAFAATSLAILLAVPLLPPGMRTMLEHQGAWHYLSNSEALVVGIGAAMSLMFLWSQRRFFQEKNRKHH